jgi:acetyl esterase/lipase
MTRPFLLALLLTASAATGALAQGGPGDGPPGGGPGGPSEPYTLHADLAYADRDAVRNLLDIYVPEDVENPPIVMVIHGGGFFLGSKADPTGLDLFMRAGIAVASMNYRLSDTAQWPGQLDDLTDAFAFLRENGETYGYDATRIASFGGSAGGHLSATAGIALAANPATRLRASAVLFPPIDFGQMDADAAAIGMTPTTGATADAESAESRLIGGAVGENPELALAASPLSLLATLPGDTPLPDFIILHGAKDTNIARGQSGRLMTALLNREGVGRIEYQLLPEGTHGGGEFDRLDPMLDVIDFLQAALDD